MTSLSRSQLVSLTQALRDEPMLSVYIDGSADDPSGKAWRTALAHALARARSAEQLDHTGRREFDAAAALLQERLAGQAAGLGAPGWVGFIGPREVYYANTCAIALPTQVVWARGPQVGPYVRALAAAHPAILAMIDARKVEIFEYGAGSLRRVQELRAHHANGQPAHLGAAPREHYHVGTRGGTGRDRLQRALREGTARMEREAAITLVKRAGRSVPILIAGIPQHRRELYKRTVTVGGTNLLELDSLDVHATPAQIVAAIDEGTALLRRERIEREVMAVIEAAGARGAAAVGPGTTSWALDQGRVQALYLTPRFLEEHGREAEVAVRGALHQHADIDIVASDGAALLDAHGGIAVRLRYPLALR